METTIVYWGYMVSGLGFNGNYYNILGLYGALFRIPKPSTLQRREPLAGEGLVSQDPGLDGSSLGVFSSRGLGF